MESMQRKKRLIYNTISSLMFQIATIVCGFILPRLILKAYGSEVNGLVNSIMQFLAIISFLELGVGVVVEATLYKPLADKDSNKVSMIIASANKFFSKIGFILIFYVCFLIIFFPLFMKREFNFWYTATLIIAISISSFAQYFFGIVNRLLLTADQKGYLQYNAQTISTIVNTTVCFVLIKFGLEIQIVKLTTSLIYLIQPFIIQIYVSKNYNINKKIKYKGEPIIQKWHGVAQHVCSIALDGSDTIVLTLFSTLQNVSIYSVYYLVVKGVTQLFTSLTQGVEALIGELWAKKEYNELQHFYEWLQWAIHTGTVFIFGMTAVLIVPFVEIYTLGIHDANYLQFGFAVLLVLAHGGHCLRLPYSTVILAVGHFKQTERCYFIAAILNIVISIATVKKYGLMGVAVGTLIAMIYQTIWMARYVSKYMIECSVNVFLKQIIVDIIIFSFVILATKANSLGNVSYVNWIMLAIKDALVWIPIVIIVNLVFYPNKIVQLVKRVKIKMYQKK